jgi:hypothetical protein
MSEGLEIRSLAEGEVAAWCGGPRAARQREETELRRLLRQGDCRLDDLWWVREEGRVLGRAQLLRREPGLELVRLELPWDGPWRGLARRLLAALGAALDASEGRVLDWWLHEDARPRPEEWAPLAIEAGFEPGETLEDLRLATLPVVAARSRDDAGWRALSAGGHLRWQADWTDARLQIELDNAGGVELSCEDAGPADAAAWELRWTELFGRLQRLGVSALDWPAAPEGAAREALLALARREGCPVRLDRRRRWTRPAPSLPPTGEDR